MSLKSYLKIKLFFQTSTSEWGIQSIARSQSAKFRNFTVHNFCKWCIFAFGFDFEQHLRQTIWFDFHSIETLFHDRKASRLRPLFRSRFMYNFTYFLTKIKI